jgi:hypothetical protein
MLLQLQTIRCLALFSFSVVNWSYKENYAKQMSFEMCKDIMLLICDKSVTTQNLAFFELLV